MKVAINTGPVESEDKFRGIGVNTRELIHELEKIKGLELDIIDFSTSDLKKYDVVHYPSFRSFSITLPKNKPARKMVLTIHDLIPLIYPQAYPAGIKGRLRFREQKMRLKNIDAIITISETSKKDICRFLGVNPRKVHVVYLAPQGVVKKITDQAALKNVKQKYKLPSKFVLYVGDVNYNKNTLNLIAACKKAKVKLVLVGKNALDVEKYARQTSIKGPRDVVRSVLGMSHPEQAHYKKLSEEFKSNKNVIRLGYVEDKDLSVIYNLATLYCQPSFYEGFGLPVLEAMAAGTPVVASKTQALVEIAGEAALYFDAKDVDDMAKVIRLVMDDKKVQEELIAAGNKQVKKYSWQKSAQETFDVYKKILTH